MNRYSLEDWITWYEKKSGEKFVQEIGWALEFHPEFGFLVWKQEHEIFFLGPMSTKSLPFWISWIEKQAQALGCNCAKSFTRRNATVLVQRFHKVKICRLFMQILS